MKKEFQILKNRPEISIILTRDSVCASDDVYTFILTRGGSTNVKSDLDLKRIINRSFLRSMLLTWYVL